MGKTQTPNYNLTKDDQNEFYDILMHAQNMDLIDGALKGLSDNKVSKVEGKGLSTNDYTTIEKQKLAGIEDGATNYQHPSTHSLDIITETSLRKIFSSTERIKLAGIETSANNYTHPSTHSLDMITETTVKKIMTSTERTKLAGIASGAQVNTVTSVAGKTGAVSVTKSDVGLSAVLNYGIATTAEAQAGTSNAKYMTPLTVKEEIHMLAVSSVSPGEVLAFKHPVNDTYFNSSSYYKKRAWMQVGIGGTYRVSFDMKVRSASDILYGRIYVNGIARGTVRQTTSTSFITYTEDITIDHGDTVELWFKNTPTYQCDWGNFELKVNYPFPTLIDYDFDRQEG